MLTTADIKRNQILADSRARADRIIAAEINKQFNPMRVQYGLKPKIANDEAAREFLGKAGLLPNEIEHAMRLAMDARRPAPAPARSVARQLADDRAMDFLASRGLAPQDVATALRIAQDGRLDGLGDLLDALEAPASKELMSPASGPGGQPGGGMLPKAAASPAGIGKTNGGIKSGQMVVSNKPTVNNTDEDGMDAEADPQLLQSLLSQIEAAAAKQPDIIDQLHAAISNMHPDNAVAVSKQAPPGGPSNLGGPPAPGGSPAPGGPGGSNLQSAFRQLNNEHAKGFPQPKPPQPGSASMLQGGGDPNKAMDSVPTGDSRAGELRRLRDRTLRDWRGRVRKVASDTAIDAVIRVAVKRMRRRAEGQYRTFGLRHTALARG